MKNIQAEPTVQNLRQEEFIQAMEAIRIKAGGIFHPRNVVEAARDPRHVLHERFEWDDGTAGDKFRLIQARDLIKQVTIHIIQRESSVIQPRIKHIRKYHSRRSERGGGRPSYESIEDIMGNKRKRQEMLEQVLEELNAYRNRYQNLVELDAVWLAIDAVMEKTQSKPIKRK